MPLTVGTERRHEVPIMSKASRGVGLSIEEGILRLVGKDQISHQGELQDVSSFAV